jgi:MFS transporter, DHA2 family, multidrug resistance protein
MSSRPGMEPLVRETEPYRYRWYALAVLAMSLLIVSLDNTILNVALPTIREDLGASSSDLQWIVDSYLLVFAGLLLAAGSLGDRFGRRRALFAGLAVFGLGSLLAALSDSSNALIASRALMGLGGAAIMPATLSIITNIFPEEERPKAIAVWAGAAGLGVALGPVTGGALIESFSWNSVFLVNLPVVAIALVAGAMLIPESRDPEAPRLDLGGIALSITGLTTLVWALIEAPEAGWTSATTLTAFGIGTLIMLAFGFWERRTDHPMIELSVFRNLRFSAANVAVTCVFFALMGVLYFLTTYLQTVLGYSPLESGVRMLPIAVGMIPASRLSVVVASRFGTKIPVAGGLGIIAAALLVFTSVGVGDEYWWKVGTCLGLMGFGMGLTMAPATEAIMGSLPKAKAGIGSAMNDVVRELGGTLGVAVLGSVLTTTYASGMEDATAGLSHDAAEAASDGVAGAHAVAEGMPASAGEQFASVADASFIDAMSTVSTVGAGAALLGAFLAAAFLPSFARDRSAEAEVGVGGLEPVAA